MKPLSNRIDERTDKSGGPDACWLWRGNHTQKFIPTIWHDGRSPPVRRLIWEAIHGPVPKGRAATTTCGTRSCVHPAHLKLVLFKSDPVERFWSHVDQSGGPDACWPWKDAASFRNGYGMFRIGWKKPIVQASRHAYQLANGIAELKTEDFVMHSCDNPPCCNPAHLSLGDVKKNNADMWSKGRGSCGEKHGVAVRKAHERKIARGA